MAQKRTDTTTQLIMDIINKDIEDVIEEWRGSVTTDISLTEQEIVEDLAEQLHWQFNNHNCLGANMLSCTGKLKDKITFKIILAIEDLFEWHNDQLGDGEQGSRGISKTKLEDKIDFIYYFEAEEALRKAVIEEDLNIDYFEF